MNPPLSIVRVNGSSMAPALEDGDFVLVLDARLARTPVGSVVVVRHRALGTIIKRVTARTDDGFVTLRGDGLLSTSSEHIGVVGPKEILGRALVRIGPTRSSCEWIA